MYLLIKDRTAVLVNNLGFREFFMRQGFKSFISITGQNGQIYICRDSDGQNDSGITLEAGKTLFDAKYRNLKDPESYFSLPRGVRLHAVRMFAPLFNADQLVKFLTTEGREILSAVLESPMSGAFKSRFRKAFEKLTGRELTKLLKKFPRLKDSWGRPVCSVARQHIAELWPRSLLPLLVDTDDDIRKMVETRLKEGT
jgi:hypothetical protein